MMLRLIGYKFIKVFKSALRFISGSSAAFSSSESFNKGRGLFRLPNTLFSVLSLSRSRKVKTASPYSAIVIFEIIKGLVGIG